MGTAPNARGCRHTAFCGRRLVWTVSLVTMQPIFLSSSSSPSANEPLLVSPRNAIVSDCIRIVSVRIILRVRHVPSPLVIYLSPLFFKFFPSLPFYALPPCFSLRPLFFTKFCSLFLKEKRKRFRFKKLDLAKKNRSFYMKLCFTMQVAL